VTQPQSANAELGRLVVEEAIHLQKENALLKEGLKKLVQAAYSEGFSEGMREHSTSRGGKPWRESKICKTLTEIVGVQQ
jgi:hypothetical protein